MAEIYELFDLHGKRDTEKHNVFIVQGCVEILQQSHG